MARKARNAAASAPPGYQVAGPDLKGLALLFLSLITLLALLGLGPGFLNETFAAALRWLVGWAAFPLTLLVGLAGLLVLLRREWKGAAPWGRVLALEGLALCLLGISTRAANPLLSWAEVGQWSDGGAVGWLVARLVSPLGRTGGIVLLLLSLVLLVPVLGLSLERLRAGIERQRERLEAQRRQLALAPPPRGATAYRLPEPAPALAPQAPSEGEPSLILRVKESVSRATKPKPEPAPRAKKPSTPAPASKPATSGGSSAAQAYTYPLPPLDLLHRSDGGTLDPNVAREKARTIEETLKLFGVPATVVQVNQGPTVTQFGVQPGFTERVMRDGFVKQRKVKVSSITGLADDLALALAAKSIRVEAPVPGRPYIGIEVPNSDTEMVTLHSVLTSEEFRKVNSPLAFALGRDVSGRPVAADLGRMPHLLIAGATGAGKSVCINTIIASLLFSMGPEQLKLMMIDPKMVELISYNGIPHLIAPVVTDMERVVGALTWAMREMDRRYKLFSEVGKRNHESYNAWAEANGKEPLPFIVIIIDELADLMMVAADQVERIICRIAQMARATGMHLILATQRPSVDVVTGLIKANVPARVAFAVASQIDSRVILDTTGAEMLLGRGDMLFQAPDSSKLLRLQGCYVSDEELQAMVSHWMRYRPTAPQEPEETPWDEIVTETAAQPHEPEDEMYEEALALVLEHRYASPSFLQRKLRIGYTRAAQLIDALEERGIVGPPGEGKDGSRPVLEQPAQEEAGV